MDDTYTLKVKIGPYEFEATGPVQVVQAQFAAFKELVGVASTLPTPAAPQGREAEQPFGSDQPETRKVDSTTPDSRLDKIMRLDGRTVSLTARPDTADTAVLLLLYGQKVLRSNDSVTGAEIIDGITSTGGLQVSRADRILDRLGEAGDVIVIGERRGRRYRLTNAGLAKARQAANDLLAIVA